MKTNIQKIDGEFFIFIPDDLMNELDWQNNDEVSIETTLDCFDDKEVTSIIVANLSKIERG